MNRTAIKTMAKVQIKGSIGTLFVMSLLLSLMISAATAITCGIAGIAIPFVMPAFSLSLSIIYLNLTDGQKPEIKDLFAGFSDFWSAFKLSFLTGLFVSLWSMLFIIPGYIKMYSYAMAPYILAENKGMPALEAIERSKYLMDGHKMDLFVLQLSFIGWMLLGSVTCGIAYIWIIPYMTAAHANFYNMLKFEESQRMAQQSY